MQSTSGREVARVDSVESGLVTDAVFFATADELREWFVANAATASELVVGFHRVGSGLASITWPEAVDEALCVGWIDSVRRRIDETSYSNRFTPRRVGSTWSAINIKRVGELRDAGRMQPRGIAAFEARDAARSAIYAYERPLAALDHERRGGRARAGTSRADVVQREAIISGGPRLLVVSGDPGRVRVVSRRSSRTPRPAGPSVR